MSEITKESVERAKRTKHSLSTLAGKLDVWTKFKIFCVKKNISCRDGLRNAIRDYMKNDQIQ